VFDNSNYPGVPKVNLHTIHSYSAFELAGVRFQPFEVMHMNLPVLGFRINDFTYITDANFIPDESKDIIRGSKVIVLNALRHEKHVSHYTLEEALAVAEEFQPEQAYFVHISHQLGKHEEVNAGLPAFARLAYDGLKILP
jgi:phosphoribosyl 1,2-cyclic phosphate phosphodiesterase